MNKRKIKSRAITTTSLAIKSQFSAGLNERLPWSGDLSDEEMGKPGGLLFAALVRTAKERKQTMKAMSEVLGVTYGYITQLRNGTRLTRQISDKFALSCADYLGVPRMTVLMLSGRISASDNFTSEEIKTSQITQSMSFISQDVEWAPFVTFELQKCSLESQYLLVRLFEKATGKVLMDKHLDICALSAEFDRLSFIQLDKAVGTRSPQRPDSSPLVSP